MKEKIIIILSLILFTSCVKEVNNKSSIKKELENQTNINKSANKRSIEKNSNEIDTLIGSPMILSNTRNLLEYKRNIKIFYRLLSENGSLNIDNLHGIIPINSNEYHYYYSLSHPEKDIDRFDYIDQLIFHNALQDQGNVLKLYLNMSEFVDGEYADSYFGELENVIQNNSYKFCKEIYDSLSGRSRVRLVEFHKKFCY